jgi:hypothetical protein
VTYFTPFERCTRPGDYMIVKRKDDPLTRNPVMGIRVLQSAPSSGEIREDSFVATRDGKVLPARVRKLGRSEAGEWEISWDLDASWEVIRVDQSVILRFQFAIMNGPLDWSKLPDSFMKTYAPRSGEACPP